MKIIHIDSDPDVIGANYKTDVGIVSDAKLALLNYQNLLRVRKTEIMVLFALPLRGRRK